MTSGSPVFKCKSLSIGNVLAGPYLEAEIVFGDCTLRRESKDSIFFVFDLV